MPIFGTDLSDFDRGRGPVDVASMARDGIVFLTHKATEGTRTQHVHYGRTLNAARAAGIPILGAYVVPRTPGSSGHGTIAQQVAYFLNYIDQQTPWWRSTPEFFLQVDTEHWGYDNVAPPHGAQMCDLLRARTGKFVIHYAPRWAYGNTIPGGEPLWASSYGTNPAVPYRQGYPGDASSGWAPYSGRTPTFLQYGSRLTIGSQPGCDANAYRGTLDQLRALVTGGQTMAGLGTDPDGLYLIWRAAAIALRHGTFQGGPEKGQSVPFSVDFSEILAHVRKLDTIGGRLDVLGTAVAKLMEAQGAAQDDIDALLTRPTAAVTLDADQVTQLGADLAAVLVAHPDTPLGEADIPAIQAGIDRYFAAHFGQPSAAGTPTES